VWISLKSVSPKEGLVLRPCASITSRIS
jgi:hypothetical protein